MCLFLGLGLEGGKHRPGGIQCADLAVLSLPLSLFSFEHWLWDGQLCRAVTHLLLPEQSHIS